MLTTNLESTISLSGALPAKDPSLPCREVGGIGWLSAKPPKLYAPQYWWNGWRPAEWVAWGSPLLKAATQGTPSMGHRPLPRGARTDANIWYAENAKLWKRNCRGAMAYLPSGTEFVVAASWWWGQKNSWWCPLESTVTTESHHSGLMLFGPQRWEPA